MTKNESEKLNRRQALRWVGRAAVQGVAVVAGALALPAAAATDDERLILTDDTWTTWGYRRGHAVRFSRASEPMRDAGLWVVPGVEGYTLALVVAPDVPAGDRLASTRFVIEGPGEMPVQQYRASDADAPRGHRIVRPHRQAA